MIKKVPVVLILFIIFLNSRVLCDEKLKYVEIFDPRQDKVVKVVQLNKEINNMVTRWVKNIDSIYGKFDPVTEDGYAVKIPLDPAIEVNNKWLKVSVGEVYLIIPENDPPFFMIFENENKLSCFIFKGDIGLLSKALGFKMKDK